MHIATASDAALVAGSDTYYLYNIYLVLVLAAIVVFAFYVKKQLRKMYREIYGGFKDEN